MVQWIIGEVRAHTPSKAVAGSGVHRFRIYEKVLDGRSWRDAVSVHGNALECTCGRAELPSI